MKVYQLKEQPPQAMRAETSLLPTEPPTHRDNTRNCPEAFGCQHNQLTHQELQRFHALKVEANVSFDDEKRWDLVESLYREYFEREPKRSGKEWMQLGFQGQYPETDFRGGGVLSLQMILRFVKRNKALVRIMEQDKAGFFFAITAINIAFFLKKYFHLADFLVPGKDARVYCSRKALKNFCRLQCDNEDSYFEVHELSLKHFYNNLWLPAQRTNGQTLLQFNALFDQLTGKLRRCFEEYQLNSLAEFVDVFGQ